MDADLLGRARELLTSPEAEQILLTALLGAHGEPPAGFAVRPIGLHDRAGVDVTALYEVSYDGRPGAMVTEFLAVTTAELPDHTVATLTRDGLTLRVWRHPADPRLPDLPAACDATTVSGWVGSSVRELTTMSYRPMRRAVLRARTGDGVAFLKVSRAKRVAAIAERQQLLAAAGIAPVVLGRPLPGVLLSAAADGYPLAEHLSRMRPDLPVPEPDTLVELLDALPPEVTALTRRPSWSERLDFHVAGTRTAMGDSDLLTDIAADLATLIRTAPAGPVVATHGDCYEANVFVSGGRPAQLIDTDSVGPGHRVDDLACVLAHLAVLPTLSPRHYQDVPRIIEHWRSDFETRVDPAALRARTAAVILSLIPGAAAHLRPEWLLVSSHWRDCALAA